MRETDTARSFGLRCGMYTQARQLTLVSRNVVWRLRKHYQNDPWIDWNDRDSEPYAA